MFSGSNILVTGADGFIGSHLVENLVKIGSKVRAFNYYNSWNNNGWLSSLNKKILNEIEIFQGDIRDYYRVKQAVEGCDYIFHLSSLIGIPYSYVASKSYIDTNVLGTLNVLEAAKDSSKLKSLLHTSTSEVYGTAQTIPIKESHPLVGQSPYAASKIAADKLVESYYLSFKLPLITARPFNTYGPRQTARAVIPTIISQILLNKNKIFLGNLLASRDFNYVTDTVQAMILLAQKNNAIGKVINIGTGKDWTVQETASLIMEIYGKQVPIATETKRFRPRKSEVNKLVADNNLLKEITNWSPRTSFKKGLKNTFNWIKNNKHLFDKSSYNI